MLIFCATQDMVDYMTPLLATVLSQKDTIDEENSDDEDEEKEGKNENDFKIRSNIQFFRLHGNMTQKVLSVGQFLFSHLWSDIYFIAKTSWRSEKRSFCFIYQPCMYFALLQDRTEVFKTFRDAHAGVLLCTVSSHEYESLLFVATPYLTHMMYNINCVTRK